MRLGQISVEELKDLSDKVVWAFSQMNPNAQNELRPRLETCQSALRELSFRRGEDLLESGVTALCFEALLEDIDRVLAADEEEFQKAAADGAEPSPEEQPAISTLGWVGLGTAAGAALLGLVFIFTGR